MKKLSYALLVILMTISLPSDAEEKPTVQASNILCDFFGIGCPVITNISTSDGDGDGKEPPKQG